MIYLKSCIYLPCNAILGGLAAIGKSVVWKENFECPKALGISTHWCNVKGTPGLQPTAGFGNPTWIFRDML